MPVTIRDLRAFKDRGERFVMLTAYDYPTARLLDEAGIPALLVGDSVADNILGYPTTDETGTPDGVGRFNHFSNSGSIYWTPSTGAWSVHGAIRSKWASMGWERSCLGYPVSDEFAIPGGRQSNFQGGLISFSFATGVARSSC